MDLLLTQTPVAESSPAVPRSLPTFLKLHLAEFAVNSFQEEMAWDEVFYREMSSLRDGLPTRLGGASCVISYHCLLFN